jgi:tetratricopeptide (TPR) repeat protein
VTHSNRAFVLISLNRPADAEDACRSAIELNLRLVDNFPDAPAFAVSLGGSYCSLGQLLNTQGKLEESLTWYAKGISVLSEVVKREPELATAREFLRTAHGAHADNLARLERHAEAITDYDHALRLGAGKERDFLRLRRAISHAGLGEHAAAVTATEAVIAESNLDGELLYNAAFVYTSAMKVVLADAALREAYGARAVALLRQAAGKGYTDLPTTRNLTMLHDRTDFQELLNTLQSMQE